MLNLMDDLVMQNRRKFIKLVGASSALLSFGGLTLSCFDEKKTKKITILHTNDTHSRLEPFAENHPKYPGMGGIAKRAKLVQDIRKQEDNVLLIDAGDIFQGTPYFNFYKGELNFKLMSMLRYDVATIGNHDLDNGMDSLAEQLKYADFPFVNCNYDLSKTSLNGKVEPYKIFDFFGIKVGVLGVGIEMEGLVDPHNFKGAVYNDPIESANKYAKILKEDEGCKLVIMLSHLGYKYERDKISDVKVAEKSENIDVIVGGHTHTFMTKPDIRKNKVGDEIIITQAGFAGINLGRLDFYFNEEEEAIITATSEFLSI
jgi:5'-nucleotidase